MKQNPPDFDWRRINLSAEYQLVVRQEGGKRYEWRTSRNWYSPSISLPPGKYSWQVRPIGAGNEVGGSDWRQFTVPEDAIPFVVPGNEDLLRELRDKPRPRSLLGGRDESKLRSLVLSERKNVVEVLKNQIQKKMARPALGAPPKKVERKVGKEADWANSLFAIRNYVTGEAWQLRAAALLWQLTRDPILLAEALRTGDALAALDPNGPTGYKSQDQASRDIAIALASAYDWLGDAVPVESQKLWLKSIAVRGQAIYDDLLGGQRRFDVSHYDSHGWTNLAYLADLSALMVGSLPESESWFNDSFRFYIHTVSPWGGEEGGWANSSAYAIWSLDLGIIPRWDSIRAATGVNIYNKPWSQGFLKYFVYFEPPSSPIQLFGDGAEIPPDFSLIKGFASRQDNPLAAWYVLNIDKNEDLIRHLAAPIPLPVEGVSPEPPETNAIAFRDIGWVAMHSAIVDPLRTSIYFRSSPYAAFNHSHADNNSFVLVSRGESLLIDSGYYDWYGSPHDKQWYWRTKAHNAITFDGGKGQAEKTGPEKMTAKGRLTEFHTNGKVDFTEGDATPAYEGALQQARRRLWYLRDENVLIIHDSLRSTTPRQFEWNIHALNPFEIKEAGSIGVKQKAARACINMLQPRAIEFTQNNKFDAPPKKPPSRNDQGGNATPDQWHGRFQTKERKAAVEFLVVVDIDCKNTPIKMENFESNRQIKVGNESIHVAK
ncbi:heparinase II/III domain-containing protein [Nitrosospira multiformis]|uniref:heparinase II/III domain-containing protein n=1 Tax=Nitrosospira multiformis TaxID=1231 RepID=UPI0015874493|nr:heparinase II/III family protein [Nitrosospira multiformis]